MEMERLKCDWHREERQSGSIYQKATILILRQLWLVQKPLAKLGPSLKSDVAGGTC